MTRRNLAPRPSNRRRAPPSRPKHSPKHQSKHRPTRQITLLVPSCRSSHRPIPSRPRNTLACTSLYTPSYKGSCPIKVPPRTFLYSGTVDRPAKTTSFQGAGLGTRFASFSVSDTDNGPPGLHSTSIPPIRANPS